MLIWFSDATLCILNQSLAYCRVFSCLGVVSQMNSLNYSLIRKHIEHSHHLTFRSVMTPETVGMMVCGLIKNY